MKSYDIRQRAREILQNLSGKYQLFLTAILLSIFSGTLSVHQTLVSLQGITISASASFFPLLIDLLLALFVTSASYTMLDYIRKKRDVVSFADANLVFSAEIFSKLLLTLLLRWFYIFLWSLIWAAGLALIGLGIFFLLPTDLQIIGVIPWILISLGGLIYLAGLGIVMIKTYAYSMAEYILYDKITSGTYQGSRQILAESSQLMKGYKWKLFLLELSFIGWYLLTALTFGLVYFYLLPYVTTARLVFYEELIKRQENLSSSKTLKQ